MPNMKKIKGAISNYGSCHLPLQLPRPLMELIWCFPPFSIALNQKLLPVTWRRKTFPIKAAVNHLVNDRGINITNLHFFHMQKQTALGPPNREDINHYAKLLIYHMAI